MEYGENFCCWAVWNRQLQTIVKLDYYGFQSNASGNIAAVIDMIKEETGKLNSITTCSYYPQAVLIPEEVSTTNEMAPMVYRDKYSVSCTDMIRQKRIVNNYLVPASTYSTIRKNFPHSPFYHAYTPLLKQVFPATDHIHVHFIPGCLKVIACKAGRLQLAQIYPYSAAMDVVYILLKIFEQFGLDKQQAIVYLSGLIEKDSALYQELYAYFLNLSFSTPEGVSVPSDEHPAHYFTSIANLAACVS
jgi:hypothetical protein